MNNLENNLDTDCSTCSKLGFVGVLVVVLAAVGALVMAWGAFARHIEQTNQRNAADIAEISKSTRAILDSATYRVEGRGMEPAVVWSGAGARILNQTQYMSNPMLSSTRAGWTILARTPNGRFFEIQYELPQDRSCVGSVACIERSYFQPLTSQQVKERLFRDRKQEIYEEIFGEPMPATEVNEAELRRD